MPLQAFHGKISIKEKYLKRVHAHFVADEIIKGQYWENGKGCAVGCTVHSNNHRAYEKELGIPFVLAQLEDGIFESLPYVLAKKWPEEFLSAIPVGSDLSLIWPKFAVWLLINKKYGVAQFCKKKEQKKVIFNIAKAYKRHIAGSIVSVEEWLTLRNAATAYAVAYATAAGAATASAAYAAYAAAADAAAAYAAYASAAYAAYAAYAAEKRIEWRVVQSKKLLKLLREAK